MREGAQIETRQRERADGAKALAVSVGLPSPTSGEGFSSVVLPSAQEREREEMGKEQKKKPEDVVKVPFLSTSSSQRVKLLLPELRAAVPV